MRNSRRASFLFECAWCVPAIMALSACTIHEVSEPPAQSAPAAIAPAPVVGAPVAEAPTAAAAGQPVSTYRPTVEAPAAAARAPASNGAASAPPATHVATAPAANGPVAPPTGVASAPPATGYVDDPAVVVGSPPPQPQPELMSSPPGAGNAWVTGHWAWRNAWVWVPGGWKAIPAGKRQWVAGSWLAQGSQYRWQPGYWA